MYEKKENISYLSHCKICGNKKLKKVIRLNEQYISATFVKSNKTNAYIDNILKKKKIVLAFGASTKGNILLQHFGIGKDKIPFISERNPTKVGLRCVGTDIELISEEKARSLKPKAMVVLPWYFKDEIVEREKQYINDGGELMFPMPYPHVVTKKAEIKL